MASPSDTIGSHQYVSSPADPPRPSLLYWPSGLDSHTNVAHTSNAIEGVPPVPMHPANTHWYRDYLLSSDRAAQTGNFEHNDRTSGQTQPSAALRPPHIDFVNTGMTTRDTRVPPRSHSRQESRLSGPRAESAASRPQATMPTTYPRDDETPEEKDFFNFTEAFRDFFRDHKSTAKMIVPMPKWLEDQLLCPPASISTGHVVCTLENRDTPDEKFVIHPDATLSLAKSYEDKVFRTLDNQYESFMGDFRSGRRANMGIDTVELVVERAMVRALEQSFASVAHSVLDQTGRQSVELTGEEMMERIPVQTIIRGAQEFLDPWLGHVVTGHRVTKISKKAQPRSTTTLANTADNIYGAADTREVSGDFSKRRQPSRKAKSRHIDYSDFPKDIDLS